MTAPNQLRIGTRTSALAMWQTNHVMAGLQAAWPDLQCEAVPFVTKGDKTLDKALPAIGGKGLFTAELEEALRRGDIDCAVHSLKDLPVENAPGLTLGAISARADVRDVLVGAPGATLGGLAPGAVVGTSSNRRRAQLLALRPDLTVRSIRGNVETRIRKVRDGDYAATLLAAAGLQRLDLAHEASEWLDLTVMLPAPGQAALAVQCRADDQETRGYLAALHDRATAMAVTAERLFLAALGGGCSAPVAAFARVQADSIDLRGLVGSPDGRTLIRVAGEASDPATVAAALAEDAHRQGADKLLAAV